MVALRHITHTEYNPKPEKKIIKFWASNGGSKAHNSYRIQPKAWKIKKINLILGFKGYLCKTTVTDVNQQIQVYNIG